MKFERLLAIVGHEPIFETGLLLAGGVDPIDVRRQLSRWVRAGRLIQLRRGVYALASPFAKIHPHPFLVANRLVGGSYVSCQSVLEFYGLIPESVFAITSVSRTRPFLFQTALGRFDFRHITPGLYFGYKRFDITKGQAVVVATPEKALLDLVHLQRGGDSEAYLFHLRLQHLDRVNPEVLMRLAEQSQRPKLRRAAERIIQMRCLEAEEYETL